MAEGWNHNIQYHDVILRCAPSPCFLALDVGCGQGILTRQLAGRCDRVTGIDLERLDRKATPANVSFVIGDVMTYPFACASFDFVAAVATLHHMPLEAALTRFKELLKPGGVLVIIGLYRPVTISDYILAATALPSSWMLSRLLGHADVHAPLRTPEETLGAIRRAAAAILPGVAITRHVLFRYSLIWRKPLDVASP